MFPLAGKDYPTSAAALAKSIREALADIFTLPLGDATVTVDGGAYPAIDRLRVDLSGAAVRGAQPPPPPKPAGPRQPGVTVARVDVVGHPIRQGGGAFDLDFTAADVRLDFDRDQAGRPMLVLAEAGEGRAEMKVAKSDLRAILLSAATAGAKAQGVTIQDLQIDLTSPADRAVAADVHVKAKKFIMSGGVRITGRADIDGGMNARLSGLACTGEGMIGGVAAGFVQGKLKEFEGRTIPLNAFGLGDVRLRDLKIEAGGPVLRVAASFGSQNERTR